MDIKEEENLYCFNVSAACHEFLESYIFFLKNSMWFPAQWRKLVYKKKTGLEFIVTVDGALFLFGIQFFYSSWETKEP